MGRPTKGNARFAELWSSGAVGAHREDQKIVDQAVVEPIAVDCDVMTEGDAERKIVILSTAPDTEDETRFRAGAAVRSFGLIAPADPSNCHPEGHAVDPCTVEAVHRAARFTGQPGQFARRSR